MRKNNIPINSISKRKMYLVPSDPNPLFIGAGLVFESINSGYGYEEKVTKFFNECCSNNNTANKNIENCVRLLDNEKVKFNDRIYNSIKNQFADQIIPSCKNLDEAASYIENSDLDPEYKERLNEAIELNKTCDRVINNTNKLMNTFNMNSIMQEAQFHNEESVTESICSLIDTYNISIKKKLNIALEEAVFIYDKVGVTPNKQTIVETAVEYFLRENGIIKDNDIHGIRKVLESVNRFITDEDIIPVNYMFNECKTYGEKINILMETSVKNPYVKDMMKRISECKTTKTAKVIVKDVFTFIKASFILSVSVTFAEVMLLIGAVFGLILVVGISSGNLIKDIGIELGILEDDREKMNAIEQKRADQIIKEIKKEIAKAEKSKNTVKEAADIFDQTVNSKVFYDPSVQTIMEPDINNKFHHIYDIVQESKDFADSADVKDLINRYKAEQNKTEGKFKTTIKKIYVKSPSQIIDETPKILKFIRTFAILATIGIPMVGPGLAAVEFIVDRYIEMTLKRDEAEKVCKFFNKEKEEIENKISKTKDEDKKDGLEEYLKCLEKCTNKLEDYRDELYSEDALDARNSYEEAASVNISDKIAIPEYMSGMHNNVSKNIGRAIQLLTNEFISKIPNCNFVLYDLFEGKSPEEVFTNLPEEAIFNTFVNPDGIINVPLFKAPIDPEDKNRYIAITDICAYVNQYLDSKCMVSNHKSNGYIYIVFNFLMSIYIDNTPYTDSVSDELEEGVANLNFFTEAVDEITSYTPSTIVSELCKDIDILVYENLSDIQGLLNISGLNSTEFVDTMKDYKTCCSMDYNTSQNIDKALLMSKENLISDCNELEKVYLQTEAVSFLRDIINEAKEAKKDISKNKGKILDKVNSIKKDVKSTTNSINNKVSDKMNKAKLSAKTSSINAKTNAKLTGELLGKKAKNIGTKEKELSRNIDTTFASLKKAISGSLDDGSRREALIKGEVIPSFSKLIKLGIGEGILMKFNPALAGISAVGLLIRSRVLNKKERYLLMDEIDIELKVVEKELEAAERDGDNEKYRKLLQFQRKLQREHQRLMYKLKNPQVLTPDA